MGGLISGVLGLVRSCDAVGAEHVNDFGPDRVILGV